MINNDLNIFPNAQIAIDYILKIEKEALQEDALRNYLGKYLNLYNLDSPFNSFFNKGNDENFIMTKLQSGRYVLKPNLKNRKFLFRGEPESYLSCKPNLFRKSEQTYYLEELIKGQEMCLLMLSHPLVQLLDIGIDLCDNIYQFEMNLYGLTQHYYNKTNLIDLTSKPEVALFFALTKYDSQKDTYTPIMDNNYNEGSIYYYTLDITDFKCTPLRTIGLQVFNRSGRQYGFLYECTKTTEFNNLKQVNIVKFKHNPEISKNFFDKFNGGRDLFPEDILSRHWRNKNQKVLSNRVVRLNSMINTNSNILKELKCLDYTIENYIPRFTDEELNEYYYSHSVEIWSDFCKKIHIPGDDGTLKEAMFNICKDDRYKWAFESNKQHNVDFSKGYLLRKYRKFIM